MPRKTAREKADYARALVRSGAKAARMGAAKHLESVKDAGAGPEEIGFATAIVERAEALWELVRFEGGT